MKKYTILLTFFIIAQLYSKSQSPCSIPDTLFAADSFVVCNDTIYQLNAPLLPGCTYVWSTAEGGTSIIVTRNGKYWLQVSNGICNKTDTITVLFNSFALSPAVENLKLCKNSISSALTAGGQNILWYVEPVGGAGNPMPPVPSTLDTGRTEYWVSQTIRGCESPRALLTVKVIDKPMFDLGNAFIIPCDALGIILQIIPDGETTYNWSNGSDESSIIADVRGKYWLYAENMCGNHGDTVIAVECRDKCVQTPTGFTPNGDGKNDLFRAACFCPVPEYHLMLYNRNGEMVFKTSDPGVGWNGYYKGKLQPSGVYVYYTEFFDFILKQRVTQKGTLVLLR